MLTPELRAIKTVTDVVASALSTNEVLVSVVRDATLTIGRVSYATDLSSVLVWVHLSDDGRWTLYPAEGYQQAEVVANRIRLAIIKESEDDMITY